MWRLSESNMTMMAFIGYLGYGVERFEHLIVGNKCPTPRLTGYSGPLFVAFFLSLWLSFLSPIRGCCGLNQEGER